MAESQGFRKSLAMRPCQFVQEHPKNMQLLARSVVTPVSQRVLGLFARGGAVRERLAIAASLLGGLIVGVLFAMLIGIIVSAGERPRCPQWAADYGFCVYDGG